MTVVRGGDQAIKSVTFRFPIHYIQNFLELLLVLYVDLVRRNFSTIYETQTDVMCIFWLGLINITLQIYQSVHKLVLFLHLHKHRSLII